MQNNKLVLVFFFENAFTIPKLAVFQFECIIRFLFNMKCFKLMKYVFQFYSICANILHRACADVSWDQRKILYSCPAFFYTIRNKPVPVFPCSGLHIYMIIVFMDFLNTGNIILQY